MYPSYIFINAESSAELSSIWVLIWCISDYVYCRACKNLCWCLNKFAARARHINVLAWRRGHWLCSGDNGHFGRVLFATLVWSFPSPYWIVLWSAFIAFDSFGAYGKLAEIKLMSFSTLTVRHRKHHSTMQTGTYKYWTSHQSILMGTCKVQEKKIRSL